MLPMMWWFKFEIQFVFVVLKFDKFIVVEIYAFEIEL